jgi:histone H3/H4
MSKKDGHYVPLAVMKRLIKEQGGDRVAEDAAKFIRDIFEKNAIYLAKNAVKMSKVAGRKTVIKRDVQNALKHFG